VQKHDDEQQRVYRVNKSMCSFASPFAHEHMDLFTLLMTQQSAVGFYMQAKTIFLEKPVEMRRGKFKFFFNFIGLAVTKMYFTLCK